MTRMRRKGRWRQNQRVRRHGTKDVSNENIANARKWNCQQEAYILAQKSYSLFEPSTMLLNNVVGNNVSQPACAVTYNVSEYTNATCISKLNAHIDGEQNLLAIMSTARHSLEVGIFTPGHGQSRANQVVKKQNSTYVWKVRPVSASGRGFRFAPDPCWTGLSTRWKAAPHWSG